MKKRLNKISIHQSSKMLGFLAFFVFAIIFWGLGLLKLLLGLDLIEQPGAEVGGGAFYLAFFLAPFFYGILSYLMYAVSFWIYNIVANFAGGVEVEVEDKE